MKIVAVASLAVACAAASCGQADAARGLHSITSSAAWAPTATKAYNAVEYVPLGQPVSPSTSIHVVVGLALRNTWMIDGILRAQVTPGSGLYGRDLTTAQTMRMFSPAGAQVAAVAKYLAANGFTNIQATRDNILVTADGTAANAAVAFNTPLNYTVDAGRSFFWNVLPAQVPASLGGIVTAVEGLDNVSMGTLRRVPNTRPSKRGRGTATGLCVPLLGQCQSGFGPQALSTFYDAPTGATGGDTKIAVFTQGDLRQVTADLRSFEAFYSLPQVPYRIIATGPPSTDTSGTPEWDLDTQYGTGIAQNVEKLFLYDAPSLTDADTSVAFSRFESDDIAKAASASFGICETFPAIDGTLAVDDEIFAIAALHGQTVFAAAGDNGTTCPAYSSTGIPLTGLPVQSFPGSSRYVVSVGGTTVFANDDNSYNAEIAWTGTGGGISTEEKSPFWQGHIVPVSTSKGVPDIAMDADPNTGADVIVNGQHTALGGTSLASPLALGLWARIETQQARVNGLGFAAALFYTEYAHLRTPADAVPPVGAITQPIGGFHDILVGTNGLPALPEFDYTTGLGTLDTSLQLSDITK